MSTGSYLHTNLTEQTLPSTAFPNITHAAREALLPQLVLRSCSKHRPRWVCLWHWQQRYLPWFVLSGSYCCLLKKTCAMLVIMLLKQLILHEVPTHSPWCMVRGKQCPAYALDMEMSLVPIPPWTSAEELHRVSTEVCANCRAFEVLQQGFIWFVNSSQIYSDK